MPEPRTDPRGFGLVFGNPAGGYMSLICFKNGSLAREAVKEEFSLEWSAFEPEGLAKSPIGNGGFMMLPFYEPEITPSLDTGGPVFSDQRERSSHESVRAVLATVFEHAGAFRLARRGSGADLSDGRSVRKRWYCPGRRKCFWGVRGASRSPRLRHNWRCDAGRHAVGAIYGTLKQIQSTQGRADGVLTELRNGMMTF